MRISLIIAGIPVKKCCLNSKLFGKQIFKGDPGERNANIEAGILREIVGITPNELLTIGAAHELTR
jgi:hypothetical protein